MNVLKNEIRYVHVFVLAFRQTDNRMTYALRSMISLFEKENTTGQFLVYWVLAIKENTVVHRIFEDIFNEDNCAQISVSDPDSLSPHPDPDPTFWVEYRSGYGSGSNPVPDPIRIQGFDDQKLENNYTWKKFENIFNQKLQFTYP